MSAILKFDLKNNYIFRRKLPKVHKKDKILHVTMTFSLKQREKGQAVDPFATP